MKANILMTIFSFLILSNVAHAQKASSCSVSDQTAIVAGLDSRANNQDLSSGERDLAKLIKEDIENASLRSCTTVVTPKNEVVFYVETPSHLAASVLFSAVGSSRVIKISAGWAK